MAALKSAYYCLAIFGILLSGYSVYVEYAKARNEDYEALCDIDERISCTSVLSSEYSFGLGIVGRVLGNDSPLNISSAWYGVMFFTIIIILNTVHQSRRVLYTHLLLNTVSIIMSVYLIYVLMFVIKKACLVCYATHAVNAGLFTCTVLRLYWAHSKTRAKRIKEN